MSVTISSVHTITINPQNTESRVVALLREAEGIAVRSRGRRAFEDTRTIDDVERDLLFELVRICKSKRGGIWCFWKGMCHKGQFYHTGSPVMCKGITWRSLVIIGNALLPVLDVFEDARAANCVPGRLVVTTRTRAAHFNSYSSKNYRWIADELVPEIECHVHARPLRRSPTPDELQSVFPDARVTGYGISFCNPDQYIHLGGSNVKALFITRQIFGHAEWKSLTVSGAGPKQLYTCFDTPWHVRDSEQRVLRFDRCRLSSGDTLVLPANVELNNCIVTRGSVGNAAFLRSHEDVTILLTAEELWGSKFAYYSFSGTECGKKKVTVSFPNHGVTIVFSLTRSSMDPLFVCAAPVKRSDGDFVYRVSGEVESFTVTRPRRPASTRIEFDLRGAIIKRFCYFADDFDRIDRIDDCNCVSDERTIASREGIRGRFHSADTVAFTDHTRKAFDIQRLTITMMGELLSFGYSESHLLTRCARAVTVRVPENLQLYKDMAFPAHVVSVRFVSCKWVTERLDDVIEGIPYCNNAVPRVGAWFYGEAEAWSHPETWADVHPKLCTTISKEKRSCAVGDEPCDVLSGNMINPHLFVSRSPIHHHVAFHGMLPTDDMIDLEGDRALCSSFVSISAELATRYSEIVDRIANESDITLAVTD
jgi:hypothetical protein